MWIKQYYLIFAASAWVLVTIFYLYFQLLRRYCSSKDSFLKGFDVDQVYCSMKSSQGYCDINFLYFVGFLFCLDFPLTIYLGLKSSIYTLYIQFFVNFACWLCQMHVRFQGVSQKNPRINSIQITMPLKINNDLHYFYLTCSFIFDMSTLLFHLSVLTLSSIVAAAKDD